jgi:hypothetical protein
MLLSSLVLALCLNHMCDGHFPFDFFFFCLRSSSSALLLEEIMEKFINSETSLISLRNIVTIFQPKKHTRKGNPGILFVFMFMQRFMSLRPLAWLRAELAALTLNLPTAFRRGEEPPGRGLGHVPPVFWSCELFV